MKHIIVPQNTSETLVSMGSEEDLEIKLEEGASLEHYRSGFETSNVRVQQAANSNYHMLSFDAGADVHATLIGEEATCSVSSLYLLSDAQTCETNCVVEHIAPSCQSSQECRAVLRDTSKGVFLPKTAVARGAQKTDASQMVKTLLLSDRTSMKTKPELEIFADDVKCAHGATCGQLDDDALFYLRSRGIPESDARNMLIEAFLAEGLEKIKDQGFRLAVETRLSLSHGDG